MPDGIRGGLVFLYPNMWLQDTNRIKEGIAQEGIVM